MTQPTRQQAQALLRLALWQNLWAADRGRPALHNAAAVRVLVERVGTSRT